MRLTLSQQHSILKTVRNQLGEQARVWLFGSRVDDAGQGGDLDLFVKLDTTLPDRMRATAELAASLQLALGEQKIDLILADSASEPLPIHQVACQTGIELHADMLSPEALRLSTLLDVTSREAHWLQRAEQRLFARPLDEAWLASLQHDDASAETLEAFVSRFGRLQDTVGDKLIPAVLRALAEKTGSAIDNLNRAEKLGLLWSAREWLVARDLRNRMVHEYQLTPADFLGALALARQMTPHLIATAKLIADSVHAHKLLRPIDAA